MSADDEAIEGRFCIVGQRLRTARLAAGLTQAELAEKAGYCDRLIRKAEGGGRLNCQTLVDIVSALRESGSVVSCPDLIVDNVAVADEFLNQMDIHGRSSLAYCEHLLADAFEFQCAGESAKLPFAGTFLGRKGMQQWLRLFHDGIAVVPSGKLTVSYFQNGNEVVARYCEQLGSCSQEQRSVWVNLHFVFQHGKIASVRKEFDTFTVAELVAQTSF